MAPHDFKPNSYGEPVATHDDLFSYGVTRSRLRHQMMVGNWQRTLPGVIVGHSGPLTARQRRVAAIRYGGPGAKLSHGSAAVLLGLRVEEPEHIAITLPPGRYRPDVGFVRVHQTTRPGRTVGRAGLPCTSAARTIVDVACGLRYLDDVRALLCDGVQRGLTSVEELLAEAQHSPRHNPMFLHTALDEVAAGARSAGEGQFLQLIRRAGLPEPELNVAIRTAGGRFVVDALWRDQAVAAEIDGAAWHLNGPAWQRDLRRQNLLHAAGLVVLRFPVRRLRDDPGGVMAELRAALRLRQAS